MQAQLSKCTDLLWFDLVILGKARNLTMANTTLLTGYTDKRGLAAYTGLSQRTIDKLLYHPIHPLPAYRPCRKLLFSLREVDAWMQNFRVGADLDRIVDECVREVLGDRSARPAQARRR